MNFRNMPSKLHEGLIIKMYIQRFNHSVTSISVGNGSAKSYLGPSYFRAGKQSHTLSKPRVKVYNEPCWM